MQEGITSTSVMPRHAIAKAAHDRWADARRGRPGVFVLRGPAGIGKSHMVESVSKRVRGHHYDVVAAAARDDDAGYRLFTDVFTSLRDLGRNPPFGPIGLAARQPADLASAIIDACHEKPLLLVVEDVHWCAAASLSVLHHLVDSVAFSNARLPLLVIMTERSPGSDQSNALIDGLQSSERGVVHRVPELTGPELNGLVEQYAGMRPSIRLLGLLEAIAEGRPLGALTLLHHLDTSGHLEIESDRLHTSVDEHELGDDAHPSYRIRRRVEEAGEQVQRQLVALAVFGGGATATQLAAFSQTDLAECATSLDTAIERKLLVADGGRYSFAHATFRSAAYLTAPPLDRRKLHARFIYQQIAEDELVLATHALRAEGEIDDSKAFDLLRRGGDVAVQGTAWEPGAAFFEAALATRAGQQLSRPERADIEMMIARCAYRSLDHPRAEEFVKRVADWAREADDWGRFAQAAELGVRYRVSRLAIDSDDASLRRELEDVHDNASETPVRDLALVNGLEAEIQAVAGLASAAVETAAKARDYAEISGDQWAIGRAVFASGSAAMAALDIDGAVQHYRNAVEAAHAADDALVALWSMIRLALIELTLGQVNAAIEEADRAVQAAFQIQNWAEGSFAAALSSAALAAAGRPAEADRRAIEAAGLYDRANYMPTPQIVLESITRMRALGGDHHGAKVAMGDWALRGHPGGWGVAALIELIGEHPVDDHDGTKPSWSPCADMVSMTRCAMAADLALRMDQATSRYEEMLEYVELVIAMGVQLSPSSGISFLRLRAELMARLDHDGADEAFESAASVHRSNGAIVEAALCDLGWLRLKADAITGGEMPGLEEWDMKFETSRSEAAGAGLGSVLGQLDRLKQSPTRSLRSDEATPGPKTSYRVVMFTDVVGSTAIGVEHGDSDYLTLIRQHDAIVRGVLNEHRGFLFDTAGDGMLAWFLEPADAAAAALQIMDEVAVAPPVGDTLRLELRIGLADGTPIEFDGDLFGTAVNLAARVLDQALVGQVLCTQSVQERMPTASGMNFVAVGPRALKGFADPVQLVHIKHAG